MPVESGSSGRVAPRTLAERISRLLDTVRRPDGNRFSDEEIASAIARPDGPTISANYVYLLRTGKRDNPTKRHLEALAEFFAVPPGYFFDDTLGEQIYEELELLAAMRDQGVRSIALRAAGMPPRKVASILSIMKEIDELDRPAAE